jgi:excisionase family DNA binding protein
MNSGKMDCLLKLRVVAERIGGICVRGVYRLIAKGELPHPVKVGRCSCLPESEVVAFIEQRKKDRHQ